MSKPKLLDLFCGAGGCSVGYYHAGFDVVGVDLHPQKRYPYQFVQADALEFVSEHGYEFDAIHASPPCQQYSVTRGLSGGQHPKLIELTREALQSVGKPYIIENVVGAPLVNALMLCGTMFGLRVIRHRLFECSFPVLAPATCCHNGKATSNSRKKRRELGLTRGLRLSDGFEFLTVTGHDFVVSEARQAMGIEWMTGKELAQAIPPAYTQCIGEKLMEIL